MRVQGRVADQPAHARRRSGAAPRGEGQHGALTQLLHALGARVEGLPFVHGAYDSVFVKDNALLVRRGKASAATLLLARPRHPERRMEQGDRRQALERRGFRVQLTESAVFEGGRRGPSSDWPRRPPRHRLSLGEQGREEEIERFVDAPLHLLELRDPHLYHLDTALAALSDGTVAFCPEAFTGVSIRRIERLFSPSRLLRESRTTTPARWPST